MDPGQPAQPSPAQPASLEIDPNPARPSIDFLEIHVPGKVAFWTTLGVGGWRQKTGLGRPPQFGGPPRGPPWEAGAYTSDAGARWRESKLTQSLSSPIHRDLTVHFSERGR